MVLAIALTVAATACSVRPVDDPGLGDAPLTTRVLAADGSLIAEWHAGINRTPVPFDRLPRHLVDAVVAIEDRRYWDHPGVDLAAVARAVAANLEAGDVVQGGSTITQQYVKNVLLSPTVDLQRKAEEVVLALAVEETLTKEEILERYLNTVYLGSGAYGVGAAAMRYFGVDVADLTLPQAATLAGVIQAPSPTNPITDPAAAVTRRNVVLDAMLDEEWITAEDHATATAAALELDVTETADLHPFFGDEVRRRLLDDPRLGASREDRAALLFGGGLTIHTTLLPDHQRAAEAAVAAVMSGRAPDAALVALDPATGDVVALVGGRDWHSGAPGSQFNLATRGMRQPGSTMKPFVLAAALERGWALDDTVTGAARTTVLTEDGPWVVANYEDVSFPDLTLADATAYSVNTSYATLVDSVGASAVAEVAARAGLGPLDAVPTLALGTEEVSLDELTAAYATFANEGTRVAPRFVTSVVAADGTTLLTNDVAATEALAPEVARDVSAALTGVVSRGTGALARIGRESAGKTGTTQDYADAWFVGYTHEVVAGVWVGFATARRPMTYPATPHTITGGSWPAIIWSRYAFSALAGTPYGDLPEVDMPSLTPIAIDPLTGAALGSCRTPTGLHLTLGVTPEPSADCGSRVPQTVGMPAGEAMALLAGLGVPLTVRWRDVGDVVAAGTVIGHEPGAGTDLADLVQIELLVAGSPAPLPSLVGVPLDAAFDRLRPLPVTIDVVYEESEFTQPGVIWKQAPLPGETAADVVTVWVDP